MRNSISKTIVAGLAALSISAATVSLPATPASAAWVAAIGRRRRKAAGMAAGDGAAAGMAAAGMVGAGMAAGAAAAGAGGWRAGGWRLAWRLGLGWLRLGLGRLRRLVGPGVGHAAWRSALSAPTPTGAAIMVTAMLSRYDTAVSARPIYSRWAVILADAGWTSAANAYVVQAGRRLAPLAVICITVPAGSRFGTRDCGSACNQFFASEMDDTLI